jgi:hypothetical protein
LVALKEPSIHMNKLLFIAVMTLLYAAPSSAQVESEVFQRKCVFDLKVTNKGAEQVLVPDFKIRSIVEGGYFILPEKYLAVKQDTLIISLKNETDFGKDDLIVLDKPKGEYSVVIKYNDINVKKTLTQRFAIPRKYLDRNFSYLKIFFNGQLFAQSIVRSIGNWY